VLAAIGLTVADLFDEPRRRNGRDPGTTIEERYPYVDEQGDLLFEVVRYQGKEFRQRRPGAQGRWESNVRGVRRVLYRLPAVIEAARAGGTIYVVEGERDVHAIEAAGAVATTNPGGAGKWRPEFSAALRGADVIVVADKDEPGRNHAAQVASSLDGVAVSVRVVEAAEGKDARDHLVAGRGLDAFVPVADAGLAELGHTTQDPVKRGTAADDDAAGHKLTFLSPGGLRARLPEGTPWLWHGYIARGALTLLAGPSKVGKSTLLFALLRAMASGETTFLDRTLTPGPVVYLSEESGSSVIEKLDAAGIENDAPLGIVTREDAFPRPAWADSVNQAVGEARRLGAALIVVDTLASWAGLAAEQEKDAGAIQAAIEALTKAAAAGIAVILIHHHRKGGGEDGEAIRGSSALVAAVDVIAEVTRPPASDRPPANRRIVTALSRWPATPDAIAVEKRDDGSYELVGVGGREEIRHQAAEQRLLEAMPVAGEGVTQEALADETGLSKQRVGELCRRLVRDDRATQAGKGRKGNPYLYRRAEPRFGNPIRNGPPEGVSELGEGGESETPPVGGSDSPSPFHSVRDSETPTVQGRNDAVDVVGDDDLAHWVQRAEGQAA
jgi:hypothetical protein